MIRQLSPQLAYKPPVGAKGQLLIDGILVNPRWVYDEKKDGSRYLAHIQEHRTTYTSRRISSVTQQFAELTGEKLEHINFDIPLLEGTVFDGEYMATSKDSSTPEPYYIFDILFYKTMDLTELPLEKRNRYKERAFKELKAAYPNADVHLVPQHPIMGAKAEFDKIIKAGGEGLVLKNLDAPYYIGKRSRDSWVKWKKEETYDVIIKGYKESDSAKYGPKGLDTFRHLYGYQYDANSDLILVTNIPATSWTDDQHKVLKKIGIANLDGKIAEVGAMERASKGVKLRHPRFIRWRDDKDAKDCTIESEDG